MVVDEVALYRISREPHTKLVIYVETTSTGKIIAHSQPLFPGEDHRRYRVVGMVAAEGLQMGLI